MADSFRTLPPDKVAARRATAHPPIRIRESAPYPGDVHPLSAAAVRGFLAALPAGSTHGLRSVELRPRNHEVGEPFARYQPTGRRIILFSLPTQWACSPRHQLFVAEVKSYGARVLGNKTVAVISWPSMAQLACWFAFAVLGHEVAHHERAQFRQRRGRQGRYADEEKVADVFAERTRRRMVSSMRARRRARLTTHAG